MKTINIELNYQIGQEFKYYSDSILDSSKYITYRINRIIIDLYSNNTYNIKYCVYKQVKLGNDIYWYPSNTEYTDKILSKVLPAIPYNFTYNLEFDFDDVIISGVNYIEPSNINSFDGSGLAFGNIIKVDNITIDIVSTTSTYVRYNGSDKNVLYDGHTINPKPPITRGCYNACLLSDLDIEKLIEIKCKELSKKYYRTSTPLYSDNFLPIMNIKNGYDNPYTGLFKFLNVEDKAIECYKKWCNKRDTKNNKHKTTGKKKDIHKSDKLTKIINSLSTEEKEELLKRLQLI